MGRKSSLFVILGILLLLAAGGVAAMSLLPAGTGTGAATTPQQEVVEPTVPVVVAQIDIAKGTLIDAPEATLVVDEVPASQFNQETQFSDLQAVQNMVTTVDITAGAAITKSAVREAGLAQKIPAAEAGQPALKAFPIEVNSLSGVADLIQPGDFVDVLGSFNIEILTLYNNGNGGTSEKTSEEGTTKMLLQDVEVLDVIKPTIATTDEAAAEPTPVPEEGEVTADGTVAPTDTLDPGKWVAVLAVTSEEAEILRFTLNHGINLTTVLRATGDHATDRTTGTTMEILVETYGLPKPGIMTIEPYGDVPSTQAPASSPTP